MAVLNLSTGMIGSVQEEIGISKLIFNESNPDQFWLVKRGGDVSKYVIIDGGMTPLSIFPSIGGMNLSYQQNEGYEYHLSWTNNLRDWFDLKNDDIVEQDSGGFLVEEPKCSPDFYRVWSFNKPK